MEMEQHTCIAHPQYEGMIKDLRETTKLLIEGQTELKMALVQLTEHLKGLERLEVRVDKIEDRQSTVDRLQDGRIDVLRIFMYKLTGGIVLTSVAIPLLMRVVMSML